jgi:uroporphyrinogen decarboxylase
LNGRERVLNAVEHRTLDRLPVGYFILLPDVAKKIGDAAGLSEYNEIVDFLGADYRKIRTPMKKSPSPDEVDRYFKYYNAPWPEQDADRPFFSYAPFGFEDGRTLSGAVCKPPFADIESVKEIESYPWPDPDWLDYDAVLNTAMKYQDKAVIINDWIPTFNSVCSFFGMDTALMYLIEEPQLIEATVEHITEFIFQKHERLLPKLQGKADFIFIGDDVCDKRGLMMGYEKWKKYFKKPLRRLVDQAHKYGFKVHEHCCGNISQILPEYIDMGIAQIEPAQFGLEGMDPAALERNFGKHIVFYGGVSTQKTLPYGTPQDVRDEVRRYKSIFKGGGYAVGSCHSLLPEFPVENILALYDEAFK